MFHHYIFMHRLASRLDEILKNATLETCFSQQKDELILGFILLNQQDFYIKASLESSLGLLSFPAIFHRAKRNSVDLFPDLITQKVTAVQPVQMDRSFYIQFESGDQLIFKMHAGRSNSIYDDGQERQLFKNNLVADIDQSVSTLSKEFTLQSLREDQLATAIKVMGKPTDIDFQASFPEIKNQLISLEKQWLTSPIHVTTAQKPAIAFVPHPEGSEIYKDPLKAANHLYQATIYTNTLETEKRELIKNLQKEVKQTISYLQGTQAKLEELSKRRSYEELGHLIMANLHRIQSGQKTIEVEDFYQGGSVDIKLKEGISPQKTAEYYYRKSKNEKKEIGVLTSNIESKQKKLELLETNLAFVQHTKSIDQLREKYPVKKKSVSQAKSVNLPYHEHQFDGFTIWVGKNAKANDQLTFALSKKEDFWLHARDVSGSHVIVRNPSKLARLPENILQFAAKLAVQNSKRKTDSLCPVSYTFRKYVRKAKDAAPGTVIMEREEVVMADLHN